MVSRLGPVRSLGLALLLAGGCAWGQNAISAHSGLIHYVEGKVLLEGQPVEPKFGEFPDVRNDQVLETQDGRAEVLLTPGVSSGSLKIAPSGCSPTGSLTRPLRFSPAPQWLKWISCSRITPSRSSIKMQPSL